MQDGQFSIQPNTSFEDLLNASDFGKLASLSNQKTPTTDTVPDTKEEALSYLNRGLNQVKQQSDSPLLPTQIKATDVDTSGRYTKQMLGWDNESLYAGMQSGLSQAAHGALKGLITAGTTFLDGTVGLIYGISSAVGNGKLSKVYDNDFTNEMQKWNQMSETGLPNYYTAKERNAKWWEPANLFTPNFLWDKFVKNIGFSLGALYSGAAVTKLLRLVPQAIGLFNAGKALQLTEQAEAAITAAPEIERVNSVGSVIRNLANTTLNKANMLSPVERWAVSTLGAVTEGGIEALQGINEHRTNLINNYFTIHGRNPEGDDLEKINNNAENLGDARFLMNIALLTATNYIQLPKILGSSYKASKQIANGIEKETFGIGKSLETGLYESALPQKGIGKLVYKAKNIAGVFFSPTEAFEETSQYAIEKGVQDYYNKAYKGEGKDWVESLSVGYNKAMKDKEGLESLLLGGLSGGLQQAGFISSEGFMKSGEIGERGFTGYGGRKAAHTEELLTDLNSPQNSLKFTSDKWLKSMQDAAARGINLQIESDKAIRQGDVVEAKDLEHDYTHNYLSSRIKWGRYDLVKDDIADFRTQASIPDGLDLLKQRGVVNQNDTQSTFLTRLNNFEKHADNINQFYQALNLRYSGIVDGNGDRMYTPEVIDKMVYAASKIADYEQRIPELTRELSLKGVNTQAVIDDIFLKGRTNETATKQAIEEIDALPIISEIKDNLKQDLQDSIELALRRKSFLKQYDELKGTPSNFTVSMPSKESPIAIKQKEGGKLVNKEVEVGKKYPLQSEPIFRDGNKISINPSITIKSATLGGEYQVEMPDGSTKYLTPSELKKYNISSTSNTSEELNKAVEKSIDTVLSQDKYSDFRKSLPDNASLQDKIDLINTLNSNVLTNAVQQQVRKDTQHIQERLEKERAEAENLRKNEELKKLLEEQQKITNSKTSVIIPSDEADNLEALDDYPRAPLPAFLSKEADYNTEATKPHQKRRLSFLSTLGRIFLSQKAAKIKVAVVSASNEASLGLSGLINFLKEDLKKTVELTDRKSIYLDEKGNIKPEHEPIAKLYIVEDKGKRWATDTEGNPLIELSKNEATQKVIEQGVFGVFHSGIEGVYQFGAKMGEQNWSGNFKKEDVEKINKQFLSWRENILTTKTSPVYAIKGVSRGIVLRDNVNKPVLDTALAATEDLDKESLIVIPTKEHQIVINDVSYNFPVGFPLLVNGSNVDFLNNRKFTEEEVEETFNLLKEYITLATEKKAEEASRLKTYLTSILYMRAPIPGQAISEAQVYFNRDELGQFNMHFGSSISIPFTKQAIENKRIDITNYLSNYYVKTNNYLLKEANSLGYEKAYMENGEVKYTPYSSYQRFLLSPIKSTPFLQTKARKSISNEDPSIVSRYTTLSANEFNFTTEVPINPLADVYETPKQKAKRQRQAEEIAQIESQRADIEKKRKAELETATTDEAIKEINDRYNEELASLIDAIPTSSNVKEVPLGVSLFGNKEETKEAPKPPSNKFGFKKLTAEESAAINREAELKNQQALEDSRRKALDNFKGKKPSIDKGEFSVLNEAVNYKQANIEKEIKYIQEKSPFSVEILRNIISVGDGVYAWGKYKQMLISLYDRAQEGTGYHELFEGVWSAFSTPKQKEGLLKEFRERKGNFTAFDGKEYKSLSYKNASDAQAKEKLADEFSEFVLSKDAPVSLGQKIATWFKDIWNFIKSILNGNISSIENLFKSIDAGKYKSASPIFTSNNTEYSFADLSYTDRYQTIRGVTLAVIQRVINPNLEGSVSLTEFEESNVPISKYYNDVYNALREVYEEDIYTDELEINKNPTLLSTYENYWQNVKDSWEEVKELTNEYLRTFSIVEGVLDDETGEINRVEKEDYSNRDYVDDRKYFMSDAKDTASRSIKLLLATLPESIFEAGGLESKRSVTTLMQEQVNYAKTFNLALSQLSTNNTFQDKLDRLEELSEKYPNMRRLFNRLSTPSNSSNPNSVLNDWKLKVRFYQAMSKQEPTAWIQYNQSDGSSFTQTANLESSKKMVVQSWIDGLKVVASKGDNRKYSISSKGELLIKTRALNFDIATISDKTKFLSQFGIDFTEEMYNNLSRTLKSKFNDGVAGVAHQLRKKDVYILENAKSLESIGNFEDIAETYIKAGNDFETTFYNIEGERQTIFISTNAVSRWVNDLNNSETRDSLLEAMPQLSNIKDSVYLNSQLYTDKGEKTAFKLDIGYIQGTIDSNGKAIPGSKLALAQRLNQEINQNLNGRYYVLVPADSKTQWLLTMKNIVGYQTIVSKAQDYENRINNLFVKYYETEKSEYQELSATLSKEDLEKRFGVFTKISNNYTLSNEEVFKKVGEFFKNEVDNQEHILKDLNIISAKSDRTYKWNGLDSDFAKKNNINPKSLTGDTIKNILTFRTLNYVLNNVEMHKLFFGSPLEYKDTKRYKLFLSPREVSFYGQSDYNNLLNEQLNKVGNITLEDNLLGKHKFSDYINTIMFSDVIVSNEELSEISKDYLKINSTDAQAWSTLTASRERRLKGGTWYEKDEEQYQYSQALDRQLMLQDGVLTNDIYPNELQNKDKTLVERGNPNISYVYVEKPITSGHIEVNGKWQPILDKFSIASFSYAAIRNSNFREHYIKMLKQDIGYAIVKSGRKIGQTEANSFYDGEGNVNKDPYIGIVSVPFSAIGVQTDTSNKKESQTRGTQVTKLIIVNLYNNGIPINEKANTLAQHNISLLKEQTEIGYKKLLDRIGAKDVDGEYNIVDKEKIVILIKDELLKREVSDNIKKLLSINPDTKNLSIAFEALPNYLQIKSILYSFVDKYITHPKVNGGPKVQVSGALMEKYGVKRERIGNKDVYVSSGLKFYTKDKPWMEVLLPSSYTKKLKSQGFVWNTTEELYDLFKNSPDADQLLSAVGFRIPTQELNSIENIKIAGFLPEEFGDTVIVPEEITTKAGSDFDIDKLSMYLHNMYIDDKGQIRVVPFFGIGAKEQLRPIFEALYNNTIAIKKKKAQASIEFHDRLLSAAQSMRLGLDFTHQIEKFIDKHESLINLLYGGKQTEEELADVDQTIVDKMASLALKARKLNDAELQNELREAYIDDVYRQSIENEYFRNMQEILSLPENFQRLVTPNTADTLKNIRDQLVELSSVFNTELNPTIMSPTYMLKTRHEGLSIKDLVGIAAVSQTGTAVSQLSKIVIDPKRVGAISRFDQSFLPNMGQPLLPHNKIDGIATISSIKDVEDNYITDNNSQLLNGTVDVFNDAFLAQINYSAKTAPIYHLLTRLGMANSKEHPIITFFMNQPIVLEFLRELDVKGVSFVLNKNAAEKARIKFRYKGKGVYGFSQNLTELTNQLRDNIKKYFNGVDLTNEENAQQHLILTEFLKYAALANNLFKFTQGSNYDTARMNDANSLFFKEYQHTQAAKTNIFSDINTFMDNSFIGEQRKTLINVNKTLSSVLPVQSDLAQIYLRGVLDKIAPKYISLDEKNNIAKKLELSLFNFLIQTKLRLNNSLEQMLVNAETALVNQLRALKKSSKNQDTIWGNLILQNLIPFIKGRTSKSTKNITLAVKARDVFTKNLYDSAFEELFNNIETQDFARSLIKLSFLQSGINSSRISYKDYIPAELYASTVNSIMDELLNPTSLQSFIDSGTFYKNNWDDDNIVPIVKEEDAPFTRYKKFEEFIQYLKKQGRYTREEKAPSLVWVSGYNQVSPYITHIQYLEDGEETVEIKRMYQRLEDELGRGIQVRRQDEEDPSSPPRQHSLFVHVSAWGDSYRAQEHYDYINGTVFQNGYRNPKNEISPREAFDYISFGGASEDNNINEEDPTPPITPLTPKQTTTSKIDFKEYPIAGYRDRTIKNASADITIALAVDFNSLGETLTKSSVLAQKKIYYPINPLTLEKRLQEEGKLIVEKIKGLGKNIVEINIAGNGIYTMKGKMTQERMDDVTYKLLSYIKDSLPNVIINVRTGGQTGFDEAGAKAASKLGLPTTVLAPKGWKYRNMSGTDISNETSFKARFDSSVSTPKVETTNTPVKEEELPSPPQITEATRSTKKEKYTITLQNGIVEEREGYKLIIKEYPNFQGFITGDSKSGWYVDELTTGRRIGGVENTIKDALEKLPAYLNKANQDEAKKPILQSIGLFKNFEDFKDSLDKKDCK